MVQGSRLREVAEGEDAVEAQPQLSSQLDAAAQQRMNAATAMLFAGIKALSQRAVVAFASLVDLALIGSAFTLWLLTIGQPTTPQLIGLGGYAAFVLAAILLRRR